MTMTHGPRGKMGVRYLRESGCAMTADAKPVYLRVEGMLIEVILRTNTRRFAGRCAVVANQTQAEQRS